MKKLLVLACLLGSVNAFAFTNQKCTKGSDVRYVRVLTVPVQSAPKVITSCLVETDRVANPGKHFKVRVFSSRTASRCDTQAAKVQADYVKKLFVCVNE